MSVFVELAVNELLKIEIKKIEVVAKLAPQTNSMMYANYFIPSTSSHDYVRGDVVKDSVCLKSRSLFVSVERKDKGDRVNILCDLDNVCILNIEK